MKTVENQINPETFGKVAVLMGGLHAEREISLISGKAVIAACQRLGINAHAIDVGHTISQDMLNGKFDRAFIALHGVGGEDGSIQGLLECMKIPYTGSNVLSSALAMDKQQTKLLWATNGLPTPPAMEINHDTPLDQILSELGLPLAIKPISEGSSLGISKVTHPEQLEGAIAKALSFGGRILAERWIDGAEFTIGILAMEPLPVIHIVTPEGFYDYQAKYFSETTQYLIPSGLPKFQEETLQQLAIKAFEILGCRHWGRIDAMQDDQGNFWLLEANTIPGLTDHSLVPKAAQAIGINFDNLVWRILEQTL